MTDTNIDNKEDVLRVYEVGYLLLPSIPEEKLADHVSALKKIIADEGGEFISEENPQARTLAYEMVKSINTRNDKFKSAYFGWIKFDMPAESIPALQEKLTAFETMLRFLLIKTTREDTFVPRRLESETAGNAESDNAEEKKETPATDAKSAPELVDKKIDELVTE